MQKRFNCKYAHIWTCMKSHDLRFPIPAIHLPQAYTSKRCILIQVLPGEALLYFSCTFVVMRIPNLEMHHQIWYTHWGQEVPE